MKATSSSEVAWRTQRRSRDVRLLEVWADHRADRLYGVWVDNGVRLPFCFEYDNGTETLARLEAKLGATPSWLERSNIRPGCCFGSPAAAGRRPHGRSFAAPSCRQPGSASGCSHPSSVTSPSTPSVSATFGATESCTCWWPRRTARPSSWPGSCSTFCAPTARRGAEIYGLALDTDQAGHVYRVGQRHRLQSHPSRFAETPSASRSRRWHTTAGA